MSYSFSVKGASKSEVEALVREQLAGVVTGQPVHKADSEQAQAAVESFLRILPDDDTKDYGASVSGWLSWDLKDGKENFTGASVNVTVGVQARKAA